MMDWEEIELGSIIDTNTDSYSKKDNWSFINYLDTGNITENEIDEIKKLIVGVDKIPSRARRKTRIGDIIYSTVRPNQKHFGQIKNKIENLLVSTGFVTIRGVIGVANNDFLYWYLTQNSIIQKLHQIGEHSTSTYPSIKSSDIEQLHLLLPSLEEQKEIAKTLSNLDKKISLLRQQNETLEQMAQTLFKRWFVDFEFPNEQGQPYRSAGGEMVASELGEIPLGWEVGKLGDNVETKGGGTPSTKEELYWKGGEILWYSPTDLTKGKSMFSNDSGKKITTLGLQKSSAKIFPAYSLLMTSRATVGEITINTKEASTNQGFITLIPNEKYSIYYLYNWIKTKLRIVHSLASGSTFPEISKTDFRGISFVEAKENILVGYNKVITPIFSSIKNNTNEIQTLTKLRDTLLPKLMSGEIRIPTSIENKK